MIPTSLQRTLHAHHCSLEETRTPRFDPFTIIIKCQRLRRRSSEATVRIVAAAAKHTFEVSMWSTQRTEMTERPRATPG